MVPERDYMSEYVACYLADIGAINDRISLLLHKYPELVKYIRHVSRFAEHVILGQAS
jgi:hypothetical protein